MNIFISIFFGVLCLFGGSLITFVIVRYYFQRASRELQTEAERLRQVNALMLEAMKQHGWIKLEKAANGDIIGFAPVPNFGAVETATIAQVQSFVTEGGVDYLELALETVERRTN